MSVGTTYTISSNDVKYYTNYEHTQEYNGTVTNDNLVNEDNYELFSQYKYTFTKNGDNYVFEEIQRIK